MASDRAKSYERLVEQANMARAAGRINQWQYVARMKQIRTQMESDSSMSARDVAEVEAASAKMADEDRFNPVDNVHYDDLARDPRDSSHETSRDSQTPDYQRDEGYQSVGRAR